jgi:L-arabinonolactonase
VNGVTALVKHPGRSVRWDAGASRWWWSGSGAPSLHAWCAVDGATLSCKLPEHAGLIAHCTSGRLLVGLPKRLCLADAPASRRAPHQLRIEPLVAVDAAEPRTGISDGCTDRSGFLVFGTGNGGADRRPIGSFYQYSGRHGLRRLALPAVAQASAICFSGDGRRMYFADAAHSAILRCDYDAERARVTDIGVFADLERGATARGAVVDLAGCLWSAQGGQVLQYDTGGKVVRRIAIDCAALAFGGAALDQLMAVGPAGLAPLRASAAGHADALFDDQILYTPNNE